MNTIAIANGAGSAGKSATATALAHLEAQAGRRVLVIDADGQATATTWLGSDPSEHTIARIFDRSANLEDLAQETALAGVQVVPASDVLDEAMTRITGPGREMRLRTALGRTGDLWDTIIIDCPGSISLITIAAIVASTHVVSVTAPSMKEIGGIGRLQASIDEVAEVELNVAAHLAAIIPCLVPSRAGRIYDEALEALGQVYKDLVTPTVRRTAKVPESFHEGVPVTEWAPREAVSDDYRAVHADLIAKGVFQ